LRRTLLRVHIVKLSLYCLLVLLLNFELTT
jgi:hypothetical protein